MAAYLNRLALRFQTGASTTPASNESWQSAAIASITGVAHITVARIRSELSGTMCQIERRVTRNGTTYPINSRQRLLQEEPKNGQREYSVKSEYSKGRSSTTLDSPRRETGTVRKPVPELETWYLQTIPVSTADGWNTSVSKTELFSFPISYHDGGSPVPFHAGNDLNTYLNPPDGPDSKSELSTTTASDKSWQHGSRQRSRVLLESPTLLLEIFAQSYLFTVKR